jgi:signal transduction histidine kinase
LYLFARLRFLAAMHTKSAIRIEVHDNGCGIATQDQSRLFQEFPCVEKSGSPGSKISGIGLGLSIVRRIDEAQQWRSRRCPA